MAEGRWLKRADCYLVDSRIAISLPIKGAAAIRAETNAITAGGGPSQRHPRGGGGLAKQVFGNVEQGEAPTPFRVGLETRLNDISDQK